MVWASQLSLVARLSVTWQIARLARLRLRRVTERPGIQTQLVRFECLLLAQPILPPKADREPQPVHRTRSLPEHAARPLHVAGSVLRRKQRESASCPNLKAFNMPTEVATRQRVDLHGNRLASFHSLELR